MKTQRYPRAHLSTPHVPLFDLCKNQGAFWNALVQASCFPRSQFLCYTKLTSCWLQLCIYSFRHLYLCIKSGIYHPTGQESRSAHFPKCWTVPSRRNIRRASTSAWCSWNASVTVFDSSYTSKQTCHLYHIQHCHPVFLKLCGVEKLGLIIVLLDTTIKDKVSTFPNISYILYIVFPALDQVWHCVSCSFFLFGYGMPVHREEGCRGNQSSSVTSTHKNKILHCNIGHSFSLLVIKKM